MIAAYKAARVRLALCAVFFALGLMAVYAKQGLVVLLILSIAAQTGVLEALDALRDYSRNLIVQIGMLFTAWAAVSLFWTPHPGFDFVRVLLVLVMGLLLISAVRKMPEADAARAVKWAMIGSLLMVAFLGLEVWSAGAFLRIGAPDWGPLPPGQTDPLYEIASRGTAILAPLTFVYAQLVYAKAGRFGLAALFVVAALAVCASSTIDAAWVAILAGAIGFGVTLRLPRFALVALFGGLIAYAVWAPVISTTLLTPETIGVDSGKAMVGTASRVGIWHKASQLIAQRPVVGYGFDSTRVLAKAAQGEVTPGTPWLALPLHTHNAVIQIWLELGGVGIAIVIAMLGAAARALWPMTAEPTRLAVTLATIASTAVMILTSYGVWQHWWIATWMFTAALLVLALRNLKKVSLPQAAQ